MNPNLKKKFPNAKGSYPEFKVCCTECGDKRYRLGLNVLKEVGHCFNCGFRVGPREFKAYLGEEFAGYSRNDLEGLFQELEGFVPEAFKPSPGTPISMPGARLADLFKEPESGYEELAALACDYLAGRNFDPETVAERYGLIIPEPGFFSGPRLVLPIFEKGALVSYQARSLVGATPKYLNPPKKLGGHGKSNFVFNLDEVDVEQEIIICEGIFSAMAAGSQAVAVLGKELSPAQRQKFLLRGVTRALILFDPGALNWALKAGNLLRDALEVRIANLEEGDPNEVSPDHLQMVMADAAPLDSLDF